MDLLQPVGAVALVLGLLAATLLFLRRRGAAAFRMPGSAGSPHKKLEVLERIALGPQHSVHLVRVEDRRILIGTGPSSCQVLDAYPGGEGGR